MTSSGESSSPSVDPLDPPVLGIRQIQDAKGDSVLIVLLRLDLRTTDNALFHYAHRSEPESLESIKATVDQLRRSTAESSDAIATSSGVAFPPLPSRKSNPSPSPENSSASDEGSATESSKEDSDLGATNENQGGSRSSNVNPLEDERRLHSKAKYLLPVYVFDEREMELSGLPNYQRKGPEARTPTCGFWKTGAFRTRFIAESVYDLRSRLREVGSDLCIRFGIPEQVIFNITTALQARGQEVEGVWLQHESTEPETVVEDALRYLMKPTGVPVRSINGKTLLHPDDLPFDISNTPDVFTPFRKRVEAMGKSMVRPTLESPSTFKPFPYDLPQTSDYALDVSYEVDVDGLGIVQSRSKYKSSGALNRNDTFATASKPSNGSVPAEAAVSSGSDVASAGRTGSMNQGADSAPSTDDGRGSMRRQYSVGGATVSSSGVEGVAQREDQVSFHDILRFLLKPLSTDSLPSSIDGNAMLQQRHPASAFPLRGGESAALERLDWYFIRGKSADSARWGRSDPPPVSRYKRTRNNLIGHAYSTKMSPFLSYGSISARQIWEALEHHETIFGEDQNTYWVRFELLWRDYFYFVAQKFGHKLRDVNGFESITDPVQSKKKQDADWWRPWHPERTDSEHEVTRLLEGRTGIPFIDANIIELRESGFMSNRGRQNIASFLAKDLQYDWRIGAEFFQSHLIDYDATSNYGNWQYVAGVGNDPRASRHFNCIKQAKDYDAHGEYVQTWIPALRNLHADHVHTPWLLDPSERRRYGLKTTKMDVTFDGYPAEPLFELPEWQKHYSRKQGAGSKMMGNPQEKVKDGKIKRNKWPSSNPPSSSSNSNRHSSHHSGGYHSGGNNYSSNPGYSGGANSSNFSHGIGGGGWKPSKSRGGSSTHSSRSRFNGGGMGFQQIDSRPINPFNRDVPTNSSSTSSSGPGIGVYRPPSQRNRFGVNNGSFGSFTSYSSPTEGDGTSTGSNSRPNFGPRNNEELEEEIPLQRGSDPRVRIKGSTRASSPGLPVATTRVGSIPAAPHATKGKGLFGRVGASAPSSRYGDASKSSARDSTSSNLDSGSGGEGGTTSSHSQASTSNSSNLNQVSSNESSTSPSSGSSPHSAVHPTDQATERK